MAIVVYAQRPQRRRKPGKRAAPEPIAAVVTGAKLKRMPKPQAEPDADTEAKVRAFFAKAIKPP